MKTQRQMRMINKRSYPLWMVFLLFVVMYGNLSAQNYGTPTRYEAENGFNSNTSNSSANAGYSGSGYVTGLVTSNSETKFDKGVNTTTPTKIDIRYANGTGSTVTNLALYIGSNQKVQDLVLPSTGSWTTWATLTVTFVHNPSWGSNIIIKSTANVSTSANIDYSELSVDDGSLPAAATPTFTPAGGTYSSTQSVTIGTSTSGATIRYTTDGSTPTGSSAVYATPLTVSTNQTLKAIAIKSGMSNSGIGSASYTISLPAVATPTFSPVAGTYSATQSVTLSTTTTGATIYYTTNGSTPTTSSTVYSAPISVASTQTVKAIAALSGMSNSAVASAAYTISIPTAATPTFSPAAGTYSSTQSVTISSATSGAAIYYTTDNSTPTTSSAVYSSPISVASTQTVKAIAVKSGMNNSGVASAAYTISVPTTATPTFTPVAGTYTSAQSVTISSATSGATIYYTTDNSTPTTSSAVYSSPLNVASSQTIKALATKSGLSNSSVATSAYIINIALPTAATPTFSPAGGTYSSTQSVTISSTTSGSSIRYTTDGTTPTAASALYSTPISVASTQTVKAIAIASGMDNSAVGSATYTISGPIPAPGTFSQTSPASAATGVSRTPSFTWGASSNASTYALVVSTSSSYTSPVINVSGLTTTSYNQSTSLGVGVQYFWKVTATNSTGSTVASNAGISFTTTSATGATGTLLREFWDGIAGQAVSNLTSNANYPNNPTSTSEITSFDAPRNVGDNYGQRIRGYITPRATGSYTFWIAGDNDVELWLSTDTSPANKVKIAYNNGYANPEEWDKSATQRSAAINLVSGNSYYVEALHKEYNQGDHVSVAWQAPGGSRVIVPSLYLSTVIPPPPSLPSAFSQSAPANAATNVSKNPTFTWASSAASESYSLVVSTNSSFSNPVINVTGLTGTTYTTATSLAYNTLYYWKVSAVNYVGTTVASNAGLSFTTAPQSQPGAFSQTAPVSGSTGVTTFPTFTWGESLNANSYSLVVSTNSAYTSPVVNLSNLNALSYSMNVPLDVNTTYYWKVTSTNEVGSKVAANAGSSFTTAATSGTSYYVSPSGTDIPGNGLTPATAWKTLAYAASQVTAGINGNKTIRLAAGTYVETAAVVVQVGVNITGSGESNTIIKSSGVPSADGLPATVNNKLYYDGSLIQLISPIYSGTNPRYGSPAQMLPATDGNQTLSGFTIDGMGRSLKAGVWVESRNNVTMHHVTVKNCKSRGAVFAKSDMYWYVPLPDGKWMYNTKVYDCTFINNSADLTEETIGNLCLGGLDGADIYNITVNEDQGYGIKFIFVGHFRNIKLHDCNITVPESDPKWNEDISIELWNFSYGNEIYNIVCNTWLSLVNHVKFNDYQPTSEHPSNLKVRNIRMVDGDGASIKEAIECALSGVEISDCYIQDKGFGIAIWGGKGWGGTIANHDITVHHNIFTNIARTPKAMFGNSSAVFIPADVQGYNIKIYNNTIDNMWHALQPEGSTGTDIRNNLFLNTQGYDVLNGGSIVINNNLKYHSNSAKANWSLAGGPSLGTGNLLGNPGLLNTGARWDSYYKPASGTSLGVDKGVSVGFPYSGSAPDIGRWEYTGGGREEVASEQSNDIAINAYPNPSNGLVTITGNADVKISGVQVLTTQGKSVLTKTVGKSNSVDVDLSQQSNDIYIFRIQHQRGVITKKIVLMK